MQWPSYPVYKVEAVQMTFETASFTLGCQGYDSLE